MPSLAALGALLESCLGKEQAALLCMRRQEHRLLSDNAAVLPGSRPRGGQRSARLPTTQWQPDNGADWKATWPTMLAAYGTMSHGAFL